VLAVTGCLFGVWESVLPGGDGGSTDFAHSQAQGRTGSEAAGIVAETIWSGLTLGAIYVLVALGFMLSLLPSGVFNFAQGAIVAAGTYLTYQWLHDGMSMIPAVLLNLVIGVGLGLFCELFSIRPLRWGRRAAKYTELVTTVGVSTLLIGILTVRWGVNPLRVPFRGPERVVKALGIVAQPVAIILIVTAIVLGFALHYGFQRTRWGQACLAVAEDRAAAGLRGINVNALSLFAFGAAGALGTLSAFLIGPITYATPDVGTTLALGGFVTLAMGGSFLGAVPGGLIVGLASAFATRYWGASYADLSVLAVLVLVVSARPNGINGVAGARSV
jgi:branched-chain amino acid transport system permease protein